MTNRRFCQVLVGAALTCAVGSGVAGAQQPAPMARVESVPIDLATALAGAGGLGGEPQILVGAMPGWVTNRVYVPANASIVGSAFIGSTAVGILHSSDAPEVVIADIKKQSLAHAWKEPPTPPNYGGGFRPATMNTPQGPQTRITLCGDQQLLSVSAARRRGTVTEIVVRLSNPGPGSSVCAPQQLPVGYVRPPYPTLYNPESASESRAYLECSTNGAGMTGTSGVIKSTMTSDALLDHYARQMQDSGWHTTAGTPNIVGRAWTRTDSTGAAIDAFITVTTSLRDPTCRDLSLQIRTIKKP